MRTGSDLKLPLLALLVASTAFFAGCSSGREVTVRGEVSASASAVPARGLWLTFYDYPHGSAEFIKDESLPALGAFDERVYAEGDSIGVIALDDADWDGACTPGEAWGQATTPIRADGTTEPVEIELRDAYYCPEDE